MYIVPITYSRRTEGRFAHPVSNEKYASNNEKQTDKYNGNNTVANVCLRGLDLEGDSRYFTHLFAIVVHKATLTITPEYEENSMWF